MAKDTEIEELEEKNELEEKESKEVKEESELGSEKESLAQSSSETESELEREVEQEQIKAPSAEDVKPDNKFKEFLETESFSPVLEKIQETPEHIDLEQVALSAPLLEKPKKGQEFGYTAIPEQKDEPKYQDIESIKYEQVGTLPSHTDATKMQINPLEKPEISFTPRQEKRAFEEKYQSVERFEMEKAGKQDLFKRKEIKYKPSR